MVLAVLTLPLQPAAITLPLPTATRRNPVTANSRARTSISAQPGIMPHSQNITIAAMVKSLSARGSRNLPKSLTWLKRLAICPSTKSVTLAMINTARDTHIQRPLCPPLWYINTINSGMNATRANVILLASVISYSSTIQPDRSPSMTESICTFTKVPSARASWDAIQTLPSISGESA